MSGKITYKVVGRDGNHRRYVIHECVDGFAVNEYHAYDRGGHFTLYPARKIVASSVPLEKRDVLIRDTIRDF